MMIENRRHAAFDAFDIRRHGTQVGQVIGQMAVHIPPQSVENI